MHILQQLGAGNENGAPKGIYSVCSAHPLVLEAAVRQAVAGGTMLLVEATSNQVNQFGGYTGMRPANFRDFVFRIAAEYGLAQDRLILGGDHLGPNPWQNLPSEEAMKLAEEMVAEYSRAGFSKIHLDASMSCVGDSHPLSNSVVAERAARLCRVAEEASGGQPRFYVIGTEVPIPGGATESLKELAVTSYDDAAETLAIHKKVFAEAGLSEAWPRVIALVVQPGVEFNHDSVVDYVSEKTVALRKLLSETNGMVFEAHSSDYQLPQAYKDLVRDGFRILKVGPALTFALREALYALARIEEELIPAERQSRLPAVMEHVMLAHPENWEKHYHGTAEEQRLLRQFSYSDRLRYYWPYPEVQAAVDVLLRNLDGVAIPETLLCSAMPLQYLSVREGMLKPLPHDLILDQIQQVLRPYAAAV